METTSPSSGHALTPGRIQSASVEFLPSGRQILDSRIEEEETRRTNREWFSRSLKRPFRSILRILDSFLEK